MMIVSTIAVLIDTARMAEADAVLMYGSLSALVGAYFVFSVGAYFVFSVGAAKK